jgi:phosphate transport system permease protein
MTATPSMTTGAALRVEGATANTGPVAVAAGGSAIPESAEERRRRPPHWTPELIYTGFGSATGALGLTWVVFERLLPLSGVLGFWMCWYVAFVATYAGLSALQWGWHTVSDRLASLIFHTAGFLVASILSLVVGYTAYRGFRALRPSFFTQTMSVTGPLDPLSNGGIAHAMVGTVEQVALALLFSVPLGLTTALFLNEVGGRLARPVRTVVDAMSAIPSIVAGLFILATIILTFGYNRSGIAAAAAIAVEMLPVVTRAAEVVFRLVPGGLREAAFALGATRWRTVWRVVLPTARSGLATAIVLGIARGIGETAPVLLVAGFTAEMNTDPLHHAQVSLPLYIFTYVKYPQPAMITRAYGAALALLILVLALFVVARLLGGRGTGVLSRRQLRRLARPSP